MPAYADESGWLGFKRLYSVRDVLTLRILHVLRESHHLTLAYLREADAYLQARYLDPWNDLTFRTLGGRLYFEEPDAATLQEASKAGQVPFPMPLAPVIAPVREKIAMFTTRQPSDQGRVERVRNVMGNEACIRGTRIPTSSIWEWHEAGHEIDRILRAYPSITEADVLGAIEYERERREQTMTRRRRTA